MENVTVEECIITAMDGTDVDLVKYLPYILQDFWDIGTPPDEIIKLIRKNLSDYSKLNVLDLGSGKGAVSIKLASELKCRCLGIEAIEDFVFFSNEKSKEFSVDGLCSFERNDIRTRIKTLGKYDVIILGAIGPVFGNYHDTLLQLTPHLNSGGLLIINDAYADDNCEKDYPNVLRKSELLKQITDAGMELLDEISADDIPGMDEDYDDQFENVQKRCMELAAKYPEDKDLFWGYIKKQKDEYAILSNEITPAILVIRQAE